MKLFHRGMTIELTPDDARIPLIEQLLFGPSPPAAPPIPAEQPPAPVPPEAPRVEVPEGMRRFWEALKLVERRELVMLAEGKQRAVELEQALGLSQRALMGQHSRLAKLARKFKAGVTIYRSGRLRQTRKYRMGQQAGAWVKVLAAEPSVPPG